MSKAIGLYIGRFQPFHNGHKSIVDTMLKDNKENIILIGINNSEYKVNCETREGTLGYDSDPFSFEKRVQFFSDVFGEKAALSLSPIFDNSSDSEWLKSIFSIKTLQSDKCIKIYCGDKKNDSAIKVIMKYQDILKGKDIEIIEIPRNIIPISGTQIRHEIEQEGVNSIEKLVPNEVYKELKKTR